MPDYDPSSKFRKSKWRIPYDGPKRKKLIDCDEIWYFGVFGVDDNESGMDIQKFKTADPIWLTGM